MSKMNQREATFQAIVNVLKESGVAFESGVTVVKPKMTKEMRAAVNVILFNGFRAGTIELDVVKDDSELRSYVSGLQSNWLNKDTRLNGNQKHEIKNPGSRAGSGDAQLKALRGLMAQASSEAEKSEIQGYIDNRTAELAKTKKVVVNFDDLPAELKAKYAKA